MKKALLFFTNLLILIFIFKSTAYAGMQPLTPENVKKVVATMATKSEFCKLKIGDTDVKDFSEALLRGYGSAGQDPYVSTLDKMQCTDQNKDMIYGTLEITRNISGDNIIHEQVFVIDGHYLRPTNLYNEFYTLTPIIPDQPEAYASIMGVFKGNSVKKGSLIHISDVENENYADENYYEGIREFGYIVHIDKEGTIDNIYVLYQNNIYKFVKSLKEIKDVLLVDYTQNNTITSTPTPTPDPTANWKTYTNSQYSFQLKYPYHWDVKENTKYGFVMFTPPGADFFANNNNDDPIGSGKFPSVYANVINTSFDDILHQMDDPNHCASGKEKIITTDNTTALFCYDVGAPFSNIVIDIPLNNGSQTLEFSLFYFLEDNFVEFNKIHHSNVEPATLQDFKQILSTFKFTDSQTSITPTPTCTPRPACLDATPKCMIPEPASGWCTSAQTCNTDSDCPADSTCMTSGPIIQGQTPQKTCVKKGTVVPM